MSQLAHGGRLDAAIAKYGGARHEWIDLSTGINPVGYPVGELEAELWQRLPDEGLGRALDEAARRYYRVPENVQVIAANGTQSIIQALPGTVAGKKVAIVSPTYNEHAACWKRAGHDVSCVDTPQDAGSADVLIIVNPNNPDARVWQPSMLTELATELGKRGGLLVVDEAFGDCTPEISLVPEIPDNCVILRSFGKFFGLAGLRLGFAICSGEIAERLRQNFGPWNVSGPALAIGTRALSDKKWIERAHAFQLSMGQKMAEVFDEAGLKVAGRNGLFLFTYHDETSRLIKALNTSRILVRAFEYMPAYLRFGLCVDDQQLGRLKVCLRSSV